MSFILDTCVFSELCKKEPNKNVLSWFNKCPEDQIYMSSLTLGEIQFGIELLPESKKKNELLLWFNELIEMYKDSTIAITDNICLRWGEEKAKLQKQGIHLPVIDGLIACSAIEYNYTLVTRNISDFDFIDVKLLNPWK